jgi:sulfur carrier protein
MRIQINGESRELTGSLSVRQLLDLLNIGSVPVAVERNEQIVPRAEHTTTLLEDGDRIEIVQFVGGG